MSDALDGAIDELTFNTIPYEPKNKECRVSLINSTGAFCI
jgi:hypothetical protein